MLNYGNFPYRFTHYFTCIHNVLKCMFKNSTFIISLVTSDTNIERFQKFFFFFLQTVKIIVIKTCLNKYIASFTLFCFDLIPHRFFFVILTIFFNTIFLMKNKISLNCDVSLKDKKVLKRNI